MGLPPGMTTLVRSAQAQATAFNVAVVLIIALAAVLRIHGLSTYGYDGDEVFDLARSSSWAGLIGNVSQDPGHPPLFYALLKIWISIFGTDEESVVRIMPVAFGLASLGVALVLCRTIGLTRTDTLTVLFLMAINGFLIFYSQYARVFSLLQLASSLSIYYFVRLSRDAIDRRLLIGAVLSNVVLVYAHYWGWVLLASEGLAMIYLNRQRLIALAGVIACAAIASVPWVIVLANAVDRAGGAAQQIKWMGADLPSLSDYVWLFRAFNGPLDFERSTILGCALFALPIAILTFRYMRSRMPSTDRSALPVTWLMLVFLPLLLTSLGSYVAHQNLWGDRHLIIVALPYYAIVGLGLTHANRGWLGPLLRVAIIAWASAAAVTSHEYERLDWRDVAQKILSDADGTAPVVTSELFVTLPMRFHLGRTQPYPNSFVESSDLEHVREPVFWFIYRDTTWRGTTPPEEILQTAGYVVERQSVTRTATQAIVALKVRQRGVR